MAPNITDEENFQSPSYFDLSEIFIGRQQLLDLFEIYLHRWKQLIVSNTSNQSPITAPPSPNNQIQGMIVLLFGRGGFGKSTLLKHYYEMAKQEGGSPLTSNIVDWEFAVDGKRSLFNPPQGQQLDAAQYFKVLCGVLATAFEKNPREFRAYQAAVKEVEKTKNEARNVLDSMRIDDRYAWLRGLSIEAITSAIGTYIPGSDVMVKNKQVQDTANEVAKLTQEQIAQGYARLYEKLGNKLGDYLEPSLRLGLALGSDLREMARNYPLLIFFDTYEEVDEGDRLLRIVMGAAGIRVGWVIAGRDNLWAGSDQRVRNVDVEYGYKEIVPSDRGLSINFNAGGVGAFTLSDISEFFALLHERVPYQPPLPDVTEEQAKRILDVTQGVPLAIKIAAGLYMETANIDIVIEHVEGKREIVDQMVHRYLLHTRTHMEERAMLYGLALLRRSDQPTAIAAALGLTQEQAMIRYSSELSRLHRRYSFVFTEKEEPALHGEVRHFLRLWLQEHCKEPEITSINQRLKQSHEAALKDLEEQVQYSTLKERLQDDEWVGIYLDLIEQQYWLDSIEGVRHILPFMIAASIYRRDINADASDIGQFFEQQVRQPIRNWWIWASQSLVYMTSRNPLPEELSGLKNIIQLVSQNGFTFFPPFQSYKKELEAALWWRLGETYLGNSPNQAVYWYYKALSQLPHEAELNKALHDVELRKALLQAVQAHEYVVEGEQDKPFLLVKEEQATWDISKIHLAFDDKSFRNFKQLVRAIIRRMGASQPNLIQSPYFVSGTVWEVFLPSIGLRNQMPKAILFLRQKEEELNVYEYLTDIQGEKDAEFIIVLDISHINSSPTHIDSRVVWFRPESLIEMAITSKEELLGWLGRFITSQVDVKPLLPYATRGATKLFFGRDYELMRLTDRDLHGGIIIGAHQSGKTSLLHRIGEKLKQRGLTVVGPMTFTGLEDLQSFFERTLYPFSIDPPPGMTPGSWASVLRIYSERENRSPVFLLDEVDDLLVIDIKTRMSLGRQMRSLQSDGHCNFYLAGHTRLREAIVVEENPFRNFAEEIILTGLTENASIHLIQEPMKLLGFSVSDEKSRRIFKGTAGVPVLIQEFCIRILTGHFHLYNKPEIEDDAIEAVEQSPDYLSMIFHHFEYGQNWTSKSIMLITAIHADVTRQDIMREFSKHGIRIDRNKLDAALSFLVNFGILTESEPGHYKVLSSYLYRAIMVRDPYSLLEAKIAEGKQEDNHD